MSNQEIAVEELLKKRNFVKSVQALLGICSGLVADGVLNNDEIHFLAKWLEENNEVASEWPGNLIAGRVQLILKDGVISEVERNDLLQMLKEVTGNDFLETGVAQQDSPVFPVDDLDWVGFEGMTVCFTGKFIIGTRDTCNALITRSGGTAAESVTKNLDILIIGALSSPDWINTTYGRKIEKAVSYRTETGRPIILSEHQWTRMISV